jgi:hypothetical protein
MTDSATRSPQRDPSITSLGWIRMRSVGDCERLEEREWEESNLKNLKDFLQEMKKKKR